MSKKKEHSSIVLNKFKKQRHEALDYRMEKSVAQ